MTLRGRRCCQGRLRSPTLALGGWMMSEISCKRVTQFDKSGDYISHTRRDCVQRSPPDDDAKPDLRRSPSESEMHRLRDTNEKRRRCRIRQERRCCRSEKGHFAVRPPARSPHVNRYEHESFSLIQRRPETNWVRVRMVGRAKQHYIP